MNSTLPITFNADAELLNSFEDAKKILLNIEAWLNFETLKANWYGDEKKLIYVSITLICEDKFNDLFSQPSQPIWQVTQANLSAVNLTHHKNKKLILAISNKETISLTTVAAFEAYIKEKLINKLNELAKLYGLDLLPILSNE